MLHPSEQWAPLEILLELPPSGLCCFMDVVEWQRGALRRVRAALVGAVHILRNGTCLSRTRRGRP